MLLARVATMEICLTPTSPDGELGLGIDDGQAHVHHFRDGQDAGHGDEGRDHLLEGPAELRAEGAEEMPRNGQAIRPEISMMVPGVCSQAKA